MPVAVADSDCYWQGVAGQVALLLLETHTVYCVLTCNRPSKGCTCCCGLSGCALKPLPPSIEKGLKVTDSRVLLYGAMTPDMGDTLSMVPLSSLDFACTC